MAMAVGVMFGQWVVAMLVVILGALPWTLVPALV